MLAARQVNEPEAPPERLPSARSPWTWVPTLYLAEGLPYVVVMSVLGTMFKNFGMSNTDLALYTSLLYLPWVIKPFWSPIVDLVGTRRRWIWGSQLILGVGLAAVALTVPMPLAFKWTMAAFWLLAFTSATHDIAADGFYILATSKQQQAYFVGVRTTFYRAAMILAQGPIVFVAGMLMDRSVDTRLSWAWCMAGLAGLFLIFGAWHGVILPRPDSDRSGETRRIPEFVREFVATFGSFFRRPGIVSMVGFLLLFRLGEAQLVKLVTPFLLDARDVGGLGLTTAQVGIVYGTVGILALTAGGLLGGFVTAKYGLRRWLWPMMFIIHVPDAAFLYLASAQPTNIWIIQACVALEQFGYGFGLTAYLLYMIQIARGPHPTAHYAICTGFMAMGMMVPGAWSGWLQDRIGYPSFFMWVLIATIPSFLVALRIRIEDDAPKPAAG